jgi:serine/threonine-protein kinase
MSLASESASRNGTGIEATPGEGEVVAGKYRIERKLGAGGMGVVVAARHVQLNQLVAIKFLLPGTDPNGIITQRFLREARAAAALKGEHVARVFDVGTLESGAPFMVMEYLEGMSLSKLIRRHAPLPMHEAVDLMLQACKAMEEAHNLGIVHRDIKPGNMFLTKRPDGSRILKVLDFGISKMTGQLDDEAEPTLTASNMVLGSPKYFAPEQVKDAKSVDHRADVWALGLVLYYMLTGRRPFEGETMSAVCVAIATETPPRLIDLIPEAPRELDAAVMGCLIKDRERRTQTASDFAREIAPFSSSAAAVLDPLGSGIGGHAGGLGAIVPAGPGVPLLPASAQARAGVPSSRLGDDSRSVAMEVDAKNKSNVSPMLWVQVGAAVAIVAVLIFVIFGQSSNTSSDEMGSVAPVSAAEGTTKATSKATAKSKPKAKSTDHPGKRTVLVPGTAKPKVREDPQPNLPNPEDLIKAERLGTTQATLRLMQSLGGNDVIGVVPKGAIVSVKKVQGEWALVTYVHKKGTVTGWTIRNLIE